MAKPPLTPMLSRNNKPISYFESLAEQAYPFLKEEKIRLDFTGYRETISAYSKLKEKDLDQIWELAKDLNAWSEYFSSLANLIQAQYLNSETKKIELQAASSIANDATKVANGDRLSNKDPKVVAIRVKRNILRAFYDDLEAKTKFLERAHYHCKATYDAKNRLLAQQTSPAELQ